MLIEAGQDADQLMDIPVIAGQLQTMSINWKYKTVPMNNSCLSKYVYIIIFYCNYYKLKPMSDTCIYICLLYSYIQCDIVMF